MNKILSIIAFLLCMLSSNSWAQNGAGLSQGTPLANPTANPTAAKKSCASCGIRMYNVTYPWQHETWCPYYRSKNSGSSSSSHSSSNQYYSTTAAVATQALGSLLSGLFSSGSSSSQAAKAAREAREAERRQIEQAAARARLEARQREIDARKPIMERDMKEFWQYGDYKLEMNGHAFVSSKSKSMCNICSEGKSGLANEKTLSLINTKTGKYIIPPLTENIHKLYQKDKVPLGTIIINRFCNNPGNNHTRVRFFDSTKDNTDPRLDGCLFIERFQIGVKSYKKGETLMRSMTGVARIAADTLQWLVKRYNNSYNYICFVEPNYMICASDGKLVERVSGGHSKWNVKWEYCDLLGNSFIKREKIHTSVSNEKGKAQNPFKLMGNLLLVERDSTATDYEVYRLDGTRHPAFADYQGVQTYFLSTMGRNVFIVKDERGFMGAVNRDGIFIIPLQAISAETLKGWLQSYSNIAYSEWYEQEALKYVDKQGEFEKTDHFNARMNNKALQEQYLREKMANAESRYINEMMNREGKRLRLILGKYNPDSEVFPIQNTLCPWNTLYLPVPIAEAEAFKQTFDTVKANALKTAQWSVRYDAPYLQQISFTLSDGNTYSVEAGEK